MIIAPMQLNASRLVFFSLLLMFAALFSLEATAQNTGNNTKPAKPRSLSEMYDHFDDSMDMLPALQNDSAMKIYAVLQGKLFKIEGLKSILANRLDTADMKESIPKYLGITAMLKDNIVQNEKKINLRYLIGLETEANSIEMNTAKFSAGLKESTANLKEVEGLLKDIKPDSSLLYNTDTSAAMVSIRNEAQKLNDDISKIELSYREQHFQLSKYQANVQTLLIRLMELRNLIYVQKKRVTGSYWEQEINAIWQHRNYASGIWRQQLAFSNGLTSKILSNYIVKNTNALMMLLGTIVLVYLLLHFYIRRNMRNTIRNKVVQERAMYFSKYPFISSVMLVMPFSYLYFVNMPVSFVALLTLIMVLCSLPLATLRFSTKMDIALLLGMPIYFFLSYIRLNWETVYELRWLVWISNLWALLLGLYIWRQAAFEKTSTNKGVTMMLRVMAGFMLATGALGLVGNSLGMYRLSKIYGTAGVVGFYRGMAFYFFILVAMEAVYLLVENSKSKNEHAASGDVYQSLQSWLKNILATAAIIVWSYFTLFYVGLLDQVSKAIFAFFTTPRKVGDLTFNYQSIALFIGILLLSFFLANAIAYLTSLHEENKTLNRKNRVGSSVLLLRIAILTAGFLLAIAATNIPIDRITIVLGALSVGIGFGLQNIIENLVSGVILAFEKPIQVGDQIEVGDMAGTVKEVGIRSSIIRRGNGSDIIIPNGSLISQGLVNWTLKDHHMEVEFLVRVSNDSDPLKAKELLDEIMLRQPVLKKLPPKVWFDDFGKNSIAFKIQFWVSNLGDSTAIKSGVIADVVKTFKENGITMSE